MGKVTFANSKVNETISGESQKYQSHITSAGVFDTVSLAAEVAENLKDSAAYVETVLREATNVSKRHLAIGERVTIDGLCRLEIAAEGAAPRTRNGPRRFHRNRPTETSSVALTTAVFAFTDRGPGRTG